MFLFDIEHQSLLPFTDLPLNFYNHNLNHTEANTDNNTDIQLINYILYLCGDEQHQCSCLEICRLRHKLQWCKIKTDIITWPGSLAFAIMKRSWGLSDSSAVLNCQLWILEGSAMEKLLFGPLSVTFLKEQITTQTEQKGHFLFRFK